METAYKSFEFIKKYVFLNKGFHISTGFLLDLCAAKKVTFKATKEEILIDYNAFFSDFDSLYKEYFKGRCARIKKAHKDMWDEEFDTNEEDSIPSIEDYNIKYLNFIAKQKI
jgi:hypothetical protein